MSITIALDAIIAVLLVATIAYAVVLNRKLGALRDTKSEMETVVARLVEYTDLARSGIESLKVEAKLSAETLQDKLDAARGLAEDLSFLVERGSDLAERLDTAVGVARAKAATGGAPTRTQDARRRAESVSVKPDGAEITSAGTKSDPGGNAAPAGRPAPGPGAAELTEEESKLLKALQGMR